MDPLSKPVITLVHPFKVNKYDSRKSPEDVSAPIFPTEATQTFQAQGESMNKLHSELNRMADGSLNCVV